jgi:hypothetical protein
MRLKAPLIGRPFLGMSSPLRLLCAPVSAGQGRMKLSLASKHFPSRCIICSTPPWHIITLVSAHHHPSFAYQPEHEGLRRFGLRHSLRTRRSHLSQSCSHALWQLCDPLLLHLLSFSSHVRGVSGLFI